MSEKFCLKWNDFKENVNAAFGSSRDDNEFADVTLAFEDGHQMEAHKFILAASSPFFQNLLRRNKHPHPLIFMRGIKSEDMIALIDFLYRGEANVHQENLDSFLAIAEELELRGFLGQNNDQNSYPTFGTVETVAGPCISKPNPPETGDEKPKKSIVKEQRSTPEIKNDQIVALTHFGSGDLQELDEKVKSMMGESPNLISNGKQRAKTCKICGKEGHGGNIRKHIELSHLDGISLPCNICERTLRSRNLLRNHVCKNEKFEKVNFRDKKTIGRSQN